MWTRKRNYRTNSFYIRTLLIMHNITAIQHLNGKKELLYRRADEILKEDVTKRVFRIIWDWEMERVEKMNMREVNRFIDNILENKKLFDDI